MARADLVLRELKGAGVSHVVGLPDNSSAALFALLAVDPDVRLLTVTREGEAFAVAAGLWLGGRHPAVLIQNTGLLESGDAVRGTVMRMGIPLVCLITYRGYAGMRRQFSSAPSDPDPALLTRADLDSTALVTEPTLRAWGIATELLDGDEDLDRIPAAFRRAAELGRPVGLLITRELV